MIGPCERCRRAICGPFFYEATTGGVLCPACVKAKHPADTAAVDKLVGDAERLKLRVNRPAKEAAPAQWAPDDDFNEAWAYWDLSERERAVVERFYAKHDGPGRREWLIKMAGLGDELLFEKHHDADAVVFDAAVGRIQAKVSKDGWGPFERRAFYAELIEARKLDAEHRIVKRRLTDLRKAKR